MILDKEANLFRPCKYSDFCIIMDRGADFDLYKKIFEYNNIPLSVHQNPKLSSGYDILIIKNLVNLIIKIKEKEFDREFRYAFTSIARSYLFAIDDNDILEIFNNNSFYDTKLYHMCDEIAKNVDNMSCYKFLNTIIDNFNFNEKILSYYNIGDAKVRINYLKDLAAKLEKIGFTPYMFNYYLKELTSEDRDIQYKTIKSDETSVIITNIHLSKGLEFPVCYFPGLYKRFNIRDIIDRFIYDKTYGIVTPFYKKDAGVGTLFTKNLVYENYLKDEISEKIRLFYVALTRAREKIILVCPLNGEIINNEVLINDNTRLTYKSFLDIVNTIKSSFNNDIKEINLNEINLTKEYNLYQKQDLSFLNCDQEKILKKDVIIDDSIVEEKHFSKVDNNLKSKEELSNMEYGKKVHYLFEITDFKQKSDNKLINNFLNHEEFKNINKANIYKEYEFMCEEDNNIYNGIIDLLLEYEDHFDIVDYKLSDITDENYLKQLNGYKKYISRKTKKPINIYLYSILTNELKKL